MQSNAFTSYLKPAGLAFGAGLQDPRIQQNGLCPDGAPPSNREGCGVIVDPRSEADRSRQDATTRRNQDFALAGTLTRELSALIGTIATGVLTADTQRQANALAAETQRSLRNLSQYPNDPMARDLMGRVQGAFGQLPSQYQQQYPYQPPPPQQPRPFPTTAVAIGAVAIVGLAAGAYVLTRRPRKNPVVGTGRDRHFVKASKLRKRAKK